MSVYDDMLDRLYELSPAGFGIAATFKPCDGELTDLVVIDKTAGVEIPQGPMMLQTSRPAVCVRVSELTEKNLDRVSVGGGRLTFNDASWKVESTRPKPKPGSKGELYLLLQEWCDD